MKRGALQRCCRGNAWQELLQELAAELDEGLGNSAHLEVAKSSMKSLVGERIQERVNRSSRAGRGARCKAGKGFLESLVWGAVSSTKGLPNGATEPLAN